MKTLKLQVTLECEDSVDVGFASPLIGDIQAVLDGARPAGVLEATVTHLYGEEPIQDV